MAEERRFPKIRPRKLAWRDVWQVAPGNLLSLLGVLLLGWDGWEVVLFYYLETVVIGLWHAAKLALSQPGTQRNLGGEEMPMTPVFATILFVGNYGLFTAIQFYMLWDNLRWPLLQGVEGLSFWISLSLILVAQSTDAMARYFIPGKHRQTKVDGLFLQPYSRIFVQQAFAILGSMVIAVAGNNSIVAVAAFVGVKTAVELYVATFWEAMLAAVRRGDRGE